LNSRPDSCSRCRRSEDETRPQWRAVGAELVCPNCLSSIEFETARRAPISPIDRYLENLRRDLDVSPRQRRRIVSEVGGHLRESAAEEAAAHGLSRWESERAAINRMGDVESIVGGYELSRPRRSRTSGRAVMAVTAAAVVGCGGVAFGVHHRRQEDAATVPATVSMTSGGRCLNIQGAASGTRVAMGNRTYTAPYRRCGSKQTLLPFPWSATGHGGKPYFGVTKLPVWAVSKQTGNHTAVVSPPRTNPITVVKDSGSHCTRLPFVLGETPSFVVLEIVSRTDGVEYRHFQQRGKHVHHNHLHWCGANVTGRPIRPGRYWWSVLVRWRDGSQTFSNTAPIDVVRG
jgi:hypothetical protein